MENIHIPSDLDLKNLVKELTQGKEHTQQLQNHLNVQSPLHETQDFLLHEILNSYDHALSILNHGHPIGSGGDAAASDSPMSLARSPHSDDSDQDPKNQASLKKKGVARWTKSVRVWPGTGIEGQHDDGYGWRKYGQKDILGAVYPRGYYRCTHRHSQGCLATKQVQKSDDDPTIFEITYRRKHTCIPRASPSNNNDNPPTAISDPQNEDPSPLPTNPQPVPQQLFDSQTSLRVITQDLGTNDNPSFEPPNLPLSLNPENDHIFTDGNNCLGNNYSSNLISPATSWSNYFPISPSAINNDYNGFIPNSYSSESELSPIVAPITSSTISTTHDIHFPFGSTEFGSNFNFGNQRYFP